MQMTHWARVLAGAALVSLTTGAAMAQDTSKDVTVVLREEPASLDGCNASRSANGRVTKHNVVEALTKISATDGSISPALAESWEQIDDLTWRFKLKSGITFHDGEPLTAAAVARSLERLQQEALNCHIRGEFFTQVHLTGTAIDDLTLEVKSVEPLPILPTYMAQVTVVSPNTPMDELAQIGVGTGPYSIETYEPGVKIVLKRNPNWWGGTTEVEHATFVWRAESSVGAAMVEIGEADLAPYIAPQDATNPETDKTYPTAETVFLRPDTLLPILDDQRVREALNISIDREALRGTIFPAASIPAVAISPPFIPGYPSDLKPYPFDPERAKQLLEEARADGVPVDTEIHYYVRNGHFTNADENAEAIAAMWEEVGFNVVLHLMEAAEWGEYNFTPFKDDRGSNVVQARSGNPYGDAVFNVTNKVVCNENQSAMCSDEYDELVHNAMQAGGDDRTAQWNNIYKKLYNEFMFVPLFHLVADVRIGSRINFEPDIFLTDSVDLTAISFK